MPFFQPIINEPKPIAACACSFSRALCQLCAITSSFDWFTGLSLFFLIGQSITLVLVLRRSSETRSIVIVIVIAIAIVNIIRFFSRQYIIIAAN